MNLGTRLAPPATKVQSTLLRSIPAAASAYSMMMREWHVRKGQGKHSPLMKMQERRRATRSGGRPSHGGSSRAHVNTSSKKEGKRVYTLSRVASISAQRSPHKSSKRARLTRCLKSMPSHSDSTSRFTSEAADKNRMADSQAACSLALDLAEARGSTPPHFLAKILAPKAARAFTNSAPACGARQEREERGKRL